MKKTLVKTFIREEIQDEKTNLIHRNRKMFDFIDGYRLNGDLNSINELIYDLNIMKYKIHPSLIKSALVMCRGLEDKLVGINKLNNYLDELEKK